MSSGLLGSRYLCCFCRALWGEEGGRPDGVVAPNTEGTEVQRGVVILAELTAWLHPRVFEDSTAPHSLPTPLAAGLPWGGAGS